VDTLYFKRQTSSTEEWVAQLASWLEEARDAQRQGFLTYTMSGEVQAGFKAPSVSPSKAVEDLLEALSYYDPVNYPAALCVPVRRTTARFM